MKPPEQKVDNVRFCSRCGSASVEYSHFEGAFDAKCSSCGWTGPKDDLLTVPLVHDFANGESIVHALMSDVRRMLGKELGIPYLKFLTKWGFVPTAVDGRADVAIFSRYLSVIAGSVLNAVLTERARIEKEQVHSRMEKH